MSRFAAAGVPALMAALLAGTLASQSGEIGEIVSAFDLDVLYDPAILNATSIAFGPALGFTDIDTFASSIFAPGRLDFANISLLLNDELAALQGNSVLLASLTFSAIGIGFSTLRTGLRDEHADHHGRCVELPGGDQHDSRRREQ